MIDYFQLHNEINIFIIDSIVNCIEDVILIENLLDIVIIYQISENSKINYFKAIVNKLRRE